MSANENIVREQTERGSSVKLIRNSKGDVQIEVRVAVDDMPVEVNSARDLAVSIFDGLTSKYGRAS